MLEYYLIALLLTSYVGISVQHGYLSWPPQRSSLWRHGYSSPINYNDNALWCGGLPYFTEVGEKCGTCGDAYYGPHEHEAGGKYALGIIGARYPLGSTSIKVTVIVNAYHKGYFEFKICPHNDPLSPVQQECLDRHPLKIQEAKTDKKGRKYFPPKTGELELTLMLPKGIRCRQCVLQWKYKTGNSWGQDRDGNSCLGCGPQEQFQNCADISIGYDVPPEEKALGFTKRSVTVQEEHTTSPYVGRGTISPDQITKPMDANTNTLSPNGAYVVHSQRVVTSTPELPSPPPMVPDKIDISALSLNTQLQQLLSRQTFSLTNPPSPPLYITQGTTNIPSYVHSNSKSTTESNRLKTEPSTNVDNQHNTEVNLGRRFVWRNVAVHRTKNTESHISDHHHSAGLVISRPGESVKSSTGRSERPVSSRIKSQHSIPNPTSIPSKIRVTNLLLAALADSNKNPWTRTRSSGVRRARKNPVKLTRKQRRKAEKLAREQRRKAEKLAKKQRRAAANLAKKAARLARRRKTKTGSRRRSRQRRVRSSKKEHPPQKSQPVTPQQRQPAQSDVAVRMASTRNKKSDATGSMSNIAIKSSQPRVMISKNAAVLKATTKRYVSTATKKQYQSPIVDTFTGKLGLTSSKASVRPPSSVNSNQIQRKLSNSSNKPIHVRTPRPNKHTDGARMRSSKGLYKSRSSSKRYRKRYNLPRSTLKDKSKNRKKIKSMKRDRKRDRSSQTKPAQNQHSHAVTTQGKQGHRPSFEQLVANLRNAIKQAEHVAVKPDVLKSMKDVLTAVTKVNPSLVG